MNIIAADDEALSLELLRRSILIACPDCTLACFSDAEELLAYARTHPADVAFLDIEMPGINGIELARELTALQSSLNLVFVTGYDCYTADALDLFASGYVLKPVSEAKLRRQLEHLRYPVTRSVYVQTFGNFAVFVGGRAVHFSRTKSKELFAYLVDRNGAAVTRREMAAVLWEDGVYTRSRQKQLTLIADALQEDLGQAGCADIFCRDRASYSVRRESFDCDLFAFLEGEHGLYTGEYMEQYSWGESFKGTHAND